jgi:hypothetical protein
MFGSNAGNQTKCAQCSRSVYANDPQIVLDGVVYHKECAKCSDCKCQITIQNFTKSGTTLFCKTHYFKKFNEEGTYLGGDKYNHKSAPGAYVAKKTNFTSNDDEPAPVSRTAAAPPPIAVSTESRETEAPVAVVAEAEVGPESVVVEVSEAVETVDAPAPAATTGVAESPVEAEESATSAGETAAAGDANESVGEDAAVAETEGV